MRDNHQPAIAVVVSRTLGRAVALYAMPAFVANTRAADSLTAHDHDHGIGEEGADEHAGHDHTRLVGLGARLRLRPTVFLSGEISPRLAGHDPGRAAWAVAVEKKAGGHTFALAFTNSFGTTFGQLARGGSEREVYLASTSSAASDGNAPELRGSQGQRPAIVRRARPAAVCSGGPSGHARLRPGSFGCSVIGVDTIDGGR